jgi:formylglycine-generating enzyme required for sulfatase activity
MNRLKFPVFFIALWLCGGCFAEPPPSGMVLVPSGAFRMGTNAVDKEGHALSLGLAKPWYADETPEHEEVLGAYYIDKYEVTNRQYYIFCQATDHKPPPHWQGPKYSTGADDLPATHVSFFDAFAYAEWVGKRLPTEAEWEKAARGPDHFIYPWGNEFDATAANLSMSPSAKAGIKPVGSFPPGVSFYGVYDMIGNVWEWVWDFYQPYAGSESASPDYGKTYVVVRGMSFMGVGHFPQKEYEKVVALKSRALYREKLHPLQRKSDVGFRCAKGARRTGSAAMASHMAENHPRLSP